MNAQEGRPPPGAAADGLPQPLRFWALLTLEIAVVMTVLDGAIANVALPHIATVLHARPANSIWVVNAYQFCLMVLLLPAASAGEIVGYRRVSQTGMGVFTVASLACALSPTLGALVAARVVQGIGAALLLSVNSALLRHIYPRAMLGRGIGLLALTVGVSASVAPTIASAILSVAPWPFLFAINVPLGLAAFAIAGRTLPATPRHVVRFDYFSAVLSALGLGLLVVAVDGLGERGRAGFVAGCLVVSAVSLWLLVRRQRARSAPLLPVDLLRIPEFAFAIATSVTAFLAQTLAFVALPFFLQYGLGRNQVATGLLMTPWPLATGIMAPVAGRLADRYSAGMLAGLGLSVLAAGLVALSTVAAHPAWGDLAWRMALCGLGFGLFQSPNNRAMLSAAPHARAGGASGMLGTARTLGQTLGAAVLALLFRLGGTGEARFALGLAAAVAVVAAGVSVSRLGFPRRPG